MSRPFATRGALESATGDVIRHVPAEFARAMVAAGSAEIAHANGRVKSVRLIQTAASHAVRIGEPSPPHIGGVHFIRREKLDQSGSVVRTFKRLDPPE
jgi:hypothetical protein